MRSNNLLRRSRLNLLSKASKGRTEPALHSTARPSRTSTKRDQPVRPSLNRVYASKRSLSSASPPETPAASPNEPPDVPPSDIPEAEASTRTRGRAVNKETEVDSQVIELPESLTVAWTPTPDQVNRAHLPAPEILEEVLHKLQVTLHPQTQHRSIYPSGSSATKVEPTLGLYCPIEGGDYILDATVLELAVKSGADVLVVDAVQLAGGKWGIYGEAADAVQLPKNPLHFSTSSGLSATNASEEEDQEEDDDGPARMTFTIMSPQNLFSNVIQPSSVRRSTKTPRPAKLFFEALLNKAPANSKGRPLLVYIRDFPMLAPSSPSWYPDLLAAVRERRRGPYSRPASPVPNPTTIVFGMAPPITPSPQPSASTRPSSGLMSLLMSRNPGMPAVVASMKPGKSDYAEGDSADKARDRRLRDRLRRWERDEQSLINELPQPFLSHEDQAENDRKPEVIFLGPNGPTSPGKSGSSSGNLDENSSSSSFFRTSILVPSVRSPQREQVSRISRRREINELTMRMAVGAIGGKVQAEDFRTLEGVLEAEETKTITPEVPEDSSESVDTQSTAQSAELKMWTSWGDRVEVWSNVRRVADHALGSILSNRSVEGAGKATLDPTEVPWSAISEQWNASSGQPSFKKDWIQGAIPGSGSSEDNAILDGSASQESVDSVVERLKNDPDLDQHEQRLLTTIVNSASLPTSFDQVHLQPHTIDSIRTIVSLPILYPSAFQEGLLKEHAMTGCLLFGPPGTGKTLLVRALAKEAGCRMMVVSPSDVMDMYVGEGEKLVRAVFSLARRISPCVVFMDEIDALFGARMSARESAGSFAHRGVITEFMQEMDGLKSSKDDRVIVIGATNRPFDLDDAVLRRLPRRLLVDLPGQPEREGILKILLRNETLADDVDLSNLAKETDSFSGSDLKHLCVSAALDAVKENVHLPWVKAASIDTSDVPNVSDSKAESTLATTGSTDSSNAPPDSDAAPEQPVQTPHEQRIIHQRNFAKALKEITPSSSEGLGSLSELRKWNDQFGEGRKDRKRVQVWGKDRFGFRDPSQAGLVEQDGRVLPAPVPASASATPKS